MVAKRTILLSSILAIALYFCMNSPSVHAKSGPLKSQPLDYVGKSYPGDQDSSYLDYDLALREYIVYRINRRFGIALDPKVYSGFELLEMEALFKCKKKEEAFENFFKLFPKSP